MAVNDKECCICGDQFSIQEMMPWYDENPPETSYICYGCHQYGTQIFQVKIIDTA
jgi:hypothetical protein